MNFKHAIGFMMVGAGMGWCGTDGADVSSAQSLWLSVMSTLQIGIAMTYFAGRVLSSLGVLMETTATPVKAPEFELPAFAESEATFEVVRAPSWRSSQGAVLPLPVGIEEGLRRAA
jgi:hypothetical protein